MTESLKGKCNKCGSIYNAAPIGVIHKCGRCEGGRVIVDRSEYPLWDPINNLVYDSEMTIPSGTLLLDLSGFMRTPEKEKISEEQEILTWLQQIVKSDNTGLDRFTLRYIMRSIQDKSYKTECSS